MKDRCQKCAADNHKAKDCSTYASNPRGRNNVPKTIMAHYERFKPEGYKPKSHRSTSNSRSRSRQRTYADTVKDSKNSSSSTNKPSNPDKGKGRDIPLDDKSLNGSMHAPHKKTVTYEDIANSN